MGNEQNNGWNPDVSAFRGSGSANRSGEAESLSPIIASAIEHIARRIVKEETVSCFRLYQAIVVEPPDETTGKCSVRLSGKDTVMSLPYSSAVADVSADDFVWVGVVFNNFRNAIVWQKNDFS